ncbi:zinc finger protein 112-like [Penaeus indicus]|uniref:zinc finger protein 112-like n=1 Tax=Penaeus indicus TaxID=29960 RepID=UPI00300D7272
MGRCPIVDLGVSAPRKGEVFTLAYSSGSFSKPRTQDLPYTCSFSKPRAQDLSFTCSFSKPRIQERSRTHHGHLPGASDAPQYLNRPFTCDVCGKGFMRRTTLNGHRTIHDASQFSCPTCNRSFKRSSERLIHILLKVCLRKQRILRRTVSGWFCDVCDESVPVPEEHQCPVKGRRRQCPVCGMDFGGQRDHKMLTHVRQEHPEFLASL